jgi:hypothetical protein
MTSTSRLAHETPPTSIVALNHPALPTRPDPLRGVCAGSRRRGLSLTKSELRIVRLEPVSTRSVAGCPFTCARINIEPNWRFISNGMSFSGSARQSVKVFILRGFLETHVLVLRSRQRRHLHQNGRNSRFAVEMTLGGDLRRHLGRRFVARPPELGNPHQTRVPTFPQRRRRRATDRDKAKPH